MIEIKGHKAPVIRVERMSATMPQRLVDPEICSACFGCYEACPKGAVVIEHRRVAVDPALCRLCGDCVDACSSGAIDTIRQVMADAPFSIGEQLSWDRLPPEEFTA